MSVAPPLPEVRGTNDVNAFWYFGYSEVACRCKSISGAGQKRWHTETCSRATMKPALKLLARHKKRLYREGEPYFHPFGTLVGKN